MGAHSSAQQSPSARYHLPGTPEVPGTLRNVQLAPAGLRNLIKFLFAISERSLDCLAAGRPRVM